MIWIKPDGDDIGEYVCPGATCENPDRLEVRLPAGSYLELLPPDGSDDPGCELFLARLTLVPMGGAQPAKLTVVILGQDDQGDTVVGVEEVPIELSRESRNQLYVINPETFAWPIRLRLEAQELQGEAHFELEEYRLLCCELGG